MVANILRTKATLIISECESHTFIPCWQAVSTSESVDIHRFGGTAFKGFTIFHPNSVEVLNVYGDYTSRRRVGSNGYVLLIVRPSLQAFVCWEVERTRGGDTVKVIYWTSCHNRVTVKNYSKPHLSIASQNWPRGRARVRVPSCTRTWVLFALRLAALFHLRRKRLPTKTKRKNEGFRWDGTAIL